MENEKFLQNIRGDSSSRPSDSRPVIEPPAAIIQPRQSSISRIPSGDLGLQGFTTTATSTSTSNSAQAQARARLLERKRKQREEDERIKRMNNTIAEESKVSI